MVKKQRLNVSTYRLFFFALPTAKINLLHIFDKLVPNWLAELTVVFATIDF